MPSPEELVCISVKTFVEANADQRMAYIEGLHLDPRSGMHRLLADELIRVMKHTVDLQAVRNIVDSLIALGPEIAWSLRDALATGPNRVVRCGVVCVIARLSNEFTHEDCSVLKFHLGRVSDHYSDHPEFVGGINLKTITDQLISRLKGRLERGIDEASHPRD